MWLIFLFFPLDPLEGFCSHFHKASTPLVHFLKGLENYSLLHFWFVMCPLLLPLQRTHSVHIMGVMDQQSLLSLRLLNFTQQCLVWEEFLCPVYKPHIFGICRYLPEETVTALSCETLRNRKSCQDSG